MSEYEGVFWQARIIYSNRFGNSVDWTSVGSDSVFRTPKNRVNDVIKSLEGGADPDAIAKTLPIDQKNPRGAGRKCHGAEPKKSYTISLPRDLREWAKDSGVPLSQTLEAALLEMRAKGRNT